MAGSFLRTLKILFSPKKRNPKTGFAPLKNAVQIKVWRVWRIEFL